MIRFEFGRIHHGRSWFAVLDENGDPVPCDLDTWAHWFHSGGQRIICQETIDGYWISTVFIGCMHWFETMIFSDSNDESIWEDRSDTRADALAAHELAKRMVENGEIRTFLEERKRINPPKE